MAPEPLPPTLDDVNWEAYKLKTCCIELADRGYAGTIPTEIGLLTALTSGFVLSRNSLTVRRSEDCTLIISQANHHFAFSLGHHPYRNWTHVVTFFGALV